jgi:toxin ParE1/3/4
LPTSRMPRRSRREPAGYRLTEIADEEISNLLRSSARQFGPLQRRRYAAFIARAIEMISEDPERAGSRARDDLARGLRSFHVELAARRRGAASHVLFYLRGRLGDGAEGIIVVRVLHEAMEPVLHMSRGLAEL